MQQDQPGNGVPGPTTPDPPPPGPASVHGDGAENVPQWLRTTAGWSWRFVALVAAVSLLVYAVVHVQLVFVAVFLGLVITAVLRPVVENYDRVMPRGLAVGLALLSAVVVLGGLLAYVVASVAGQWEALAGEFTSGVDQIVSWLHDSPLGIDVSGAQIARAIETGQQWVADNAAHLAGTAVESAGAVVEVMATFVLAIFCSVFFLLQGSQLWRWFVDQLPAGHRCRWNDAASAGWYSFSGYARGTLIIALTNGLLAGIFLAILGIPLAAPLAVLVFIGTFIPLIGAPTAMVIAGVVALAADGPIKALIVILGVALIGQIEGHLLQPLIMGKQVALHPVVIAVGVASGTVLAGVVGAIIAVPVIAVVWTVYATLRPRGPAAEEVVDLLEEEQLVDDDGAAAAQ